MRHLTPTLFRCCAVVLFLGAGAGAAPAATPTATAVAVRDGRILSVGSLDALAPWLGNRPHRGDRTFGGKVFPAADVRATPDAQALYRAGNQRLSIATNCFWRSGLAR